MGDIRALQRVVENCIRPVRQRVLMSIARGVLESIDDSKGVQLSKVSLMKDEVRDDIERLQNHGFTSNPPAGAEVLCVFVNGNREHGFAVAAEVRGLKPATAAGEAALYFDASNYIAARAGGKFEIKNETGELIDELVKVLDALIAEPFIVNKATFTASKVVLESMKV